MILDLTQPVEKSSDPTVLHALLTALIGQRCVKADLGYADELMLHIGEPLPYAHPKLAEEKKGSWILRTRASGWRLLLADPPTLIESGWFPDECSELGFSHGTKNGLPGAKRSPVNGAEVELKAQPLAGKTVLGVRPTVFPLPNPAGTGLGLVVDVEGGSSLVVVPSPEPDEGDDLLADWELFTPYHTYLRVGPGQVWSYLASNAPAKTA